MMAAKKKLNFLSDYHRFENGAAVFLSEMK